MNQNLSFQVTKKVFEAQGAAFDVQQKKMLGILNDRGFYTNLGVLLSDQCPHIVKAAMIEGPYFITRDRQKFTGSIFQQLREAYEYIDWRNQVGSTFQGLERIDTRDYPEAAIREALIYAMVHRDHGFDTSIRIGVYSDRIEFVTYTGLRTGKSLGSTGEVSVCRNPKLESIFCHLGLMEAHGNGFKKIMETYENCEKKPSMIESPHVVNLVLPNVNEGGRQGKYR